MGTLSNIPSRMVIIFPNDIIHVHDERDMFRLLGIPSYVHMNSDRTPFRYGKSLECDCKMVWKKRGYILVVYFTDHIIDNYYLCCSII